MRRLFSISSYLLTALLGGVCFMAVFGRKPVPVIERSSLCTPVIISEFGDDDFHLDQVCSKDDLARIYGETRLLEREWVENHDCDVDGDEPTMKRMWRRQ